MEPSLAGRTWCPRRGAFLAPPWAQRALSLPPTAYDPALGRERELCARMRTLNFGLPARCGSVQIGADATRARGRRTPIGARRPLTRTARQRSARRSGSTSLSRAPPPAPRSPPLPARDLPPQVSPNRVSQCEGWPRAGQGLAKGWQKANVGEMGTRRLKTIDHKTLAIGHWPIAQWGFVKACSKFTDRRFAGSIFTEQALAAARLRSKQDA